MDSTVNKRNGHFVCNRYRLLECNEWFFVLQMPPCMNKAVHYCHLIFIWLKFFHYGICFCSLNISLSSMGYDMSCVRHISIIGVFFLQRISNVSFHCIHLPKFAWKPSGSNLTAWTWGFRPKLGVYDVYENCAPLCIGLAYMYPSKFFWKNVHT
jgi:hypothetical protein